MYFKPIDEIQELAYEQEVYIKALNGYCTCYNEPDPYCLTFLLDKLNNLNDDLIEKIDNIPLNIYEMINNKKDFSE